MATSMSPPIWDGWKLGRRYGGISVIRNFMFGTRPRRVALISCRGHRRPFAFDGPAGKGSSSRR